VVEGTRVEDAVRAFIEEVGEAPRGHNLARWDRKVCVGVMNVTGAYAQRLIDQVSAVALAIGLDIGEPGCKANVLILADSDGDALAKRLVGDSYRAFRPERESGILGMNALKVFQNSHAPVRWWHVPQTVMADTGNPATGGFTQRVRGASRIHANVREDMAHVLIILDTSKIGTASFASLADYVSMVALAQIDPSADTREFPSILNLFGTADRTARMTQWDLDYLRALYTAQGDTARPSGQERQIIQKMVNPSSGSGN
jgi:hypothetical protein